MTLRLVAALSLAAAVVVIVVSPMILEWPNPLSTPAALIVAVGCGGALLGGRGGESVAFAISVLGLVLSALWLWLASDGFGKGTPWWDDIVEAAILVAAFLVAVVALVRAHGRHASRTR